MVHGCVSVCVCVCLRDAGNDEQRVKRTRQQEIRRVHFHSLACRMGCVNRISPFPLALQPPPPLSDKHTQQYANSLCSETCQCSRVHSTNSTCTSHVHAHVLFAWPIYHQNYMLIDCNIAHKTEFVWLFFSAETKQRAKHTHSNKHFV